ncbi:lysozyme inhibitor LprI family protein [Vibrio mangrovi]|uniref:DUF1311 domain-containing protein n=1 Tax=Vibrio mangrovi TaxID=474394 RepID=A0A1Y6ISH7_9VIBR|nr:lysozyme inhibitor LprI family protein [Vibrio mangrovi]MDW6001373.1 DUF1311 domain-containing protein [Vibrio mangrovi]SMS00604.1 hypothetical protein VIM7927_01870 [Vibrio mangrovi]
MRYLLVFFLYVGFSTYADELICKDKTNASYHICLTNEKNKVKKIANDKFTSIEDKLSKYEDFHDLKMQVIKSKDDWEKQVKSDCSNYIYFIESTSPVSQDQHNICMIHAYRERLSYYDRFIDMIDTFI